MGEPTALIVNAITGESFERPLTTEEIAARQVRLEEMQARKAEQVAKATARESALAKLAALGLTEEEIASL